MSSQNDIGSGYFLRNEIYVCGIEYFQFLFKIDRYIRNIFIIEEEK